LFVIKLPDARSFVSFILSAVPHHSVFVIGDSRPGFDSVFKSRFTPFFAIQVVRFPWTFAFAIGHFSGDLRLSVVVVFYMIFEFGRSSFFGGTVGLGTWFVRGVTGT